MDNPIVPVNASARASCSPHMPMQKQSKKRKGQEEKEPKVKIEELPDDDAQDKQGVDEAQATHIIARKTKRKKKRHLKTRLNTSDA